MILLLSASTSTTPKFVAEKLKGSDVKVCTVVGFPLGMSDTRVKAFETRAAIEDGAQEVDMVINVGALKDGKYDFVRSDIQTLKEVCGKDIVLKSSSRPAFSQMMRKSGCAIS